MSRVSRAEAQVQAHVISVGETDPTKQEITMSGNPYLHVWDDGSGADYSNAHYDEDDLYDLAFGPESREDD